MTDERRDDDLAERVDELEDAVRELRDELREPARGPLGLPRPPTPREMLSFTGEYAIPTAVAVLEANVRALEMLGRVLQAADPERNGRDGDRTDLQARAERASLATINQLERALTGVEGTLDEGDLPREPAARDILDDARQINRQIGDQLSGANDEVDAPANDPPDAAEVDVDAELRSIRDEFGDESEDGDEDEDENEDD